jgi:hypothetical protein
MYEPGVVSRVRSACLLDRALSQRERGRTILQQTMDPTAGCQWDMP